MTPEDLVIRFYRNISSVASKQDVSVIKELMQGAYTLVNHNHGVGDSLMLYLWDGVLTNINNTTVKFNINISNALRKFNGYIPSIYNKTQENLIDVCDIQSKIDCGGGHFLQKIQHVCGIKRQTTPRPLLFNTHQTIPNRVVMSFDKGACNQTNIHPRARLLYPEHKQTIQTFINNNSSTYTFVEVGRSFSGLDNVFDATNTGIESTTNEIAQCDYYFAMHNGLMHIAAGLNKKSIIIVNFPSAHQLYLPCLREVKSNELSWLYPQNVHLHEDDSSELVEFLTYNNIKRAFDGDIYPFFSDRYLNLSLQ
jgi:hypothetical protein